MANKITLGYWNVPGIVQPSRYLLEIAGVKYEEVRYANPEDWFVRDKYNLGLDFPNVPYIIDGEIKLTESETIFDYLINKLNKSELLGQGNDKYTVDTIRNLILELDSRINNNIKKKGEEKEKHLNEQILPKVRDLHSFLGTKEYLIGYFTAADLYFLNTFRFFKNHISYAYKEFADTFDPFLARLEAIPQIAQYISEGRHPSYPY